MNNYVLFTDSGCDIPPKMLKEWDVRYASLSFMFDGDTVEYKNDDMDTDTFYNKMREGGVAKTSAVNADTFRTAFEEELKQGNDILYLGFSSGLSTTYNSACIAAEELSEVYPNNRIVTVDTLCASAGGGLLLYLTREKKNAGATIDEAAEYAKDLVPRMCHWFTVDDLVYLKRGGRVSAATALVGGILGIKPVLHVDDEGHLTSVTKARGRKASIKELADRHAETAVDPANGTIFISQAQCMEDAEYLGNLINQRTGGTVDLIVDVGTVIGAHAGPGTLALFFEGKNR